MFAIHLILLSGSKAIHFEMMKIDGYLCAWRACKFPCSSTLVRAAYVHNSQRTKNKQVRTKNKKKQTDDEIFVSKLVVNCGIF